MAPLFYFYTGMSLTMLYHCTGDRGLLSQLRDAFMRSGSNYKAVEFSKAVVFYVKFSLCHISWVSKNTMGHIRVNYYEGRFYIEASCHVFSMLLNRLITNSLG